MNKTSLLYLVVLISSVFCIQLAIGVEVPAQIRMTMDQIEACIQENDTEASKPVINYSELRSNWEIRWWSLFGYTSIPSQDTIKQNPDLWHQGTVVNLSLKNYCDDIMGVKRLLHGGMGHQDIKDRKVYATIQLMSGGEDRIEITTIGDDEDPIISIFESSGDNWILVDVILQFK